MITKNVSAIRKLIAAAALACAALVVPSHALAQEAFGSPEAAADAFVRAVATSDEEALRTVLGADWKRFIPIDNIDRDDVNAFLAARYKNEKIIRDSDTGSLGGRARRMDAADSDRQERRRLALQHQSRCG